MREQAGERVAKIFKNPVDVPSLPAAVQKVVQLSEKDSSPRDFADLIAADQGLTAKVLRLVNSAFYSLRSPIASLRHASMLLGTRTLKSLTLSVSVMNLFNKACAGFDPISFWRHSISVAVASQKLGAALLPGVEEDLYVAGLLHDTGVALLVQHLGSDYAFVLKLARSGERSLPEAEAEVLGTSHAEMGCTLAARWRLPAIVCDSIRWHETPPALVTPSTPEAVRAIDIVRFADQWSRQAGLDFLLPPSRDGGQPEIPEWMSLTHEEIEGHLSTLAGEVAAREEAFFPQKQGAPG